MVLAYDAAQGFGNGFGASVDNLSLFRCWRLCQASAADQKQRELEEERERLAELLQAEADEIASAEATLLEEYLYAIQALVTSNWRRPPTAQEGLSCNMLVRQIPGGEVLAVAVTSPCNADAATRESIIRAINASSPLPSRGYEEVFAREIKFTFRYDG